MTHVTFPTVMITLSIGMGDVSQTSYLKAAGSDCDTTLVCALRKAHVNSTARIITLGIKTATPGIIQSKF